MANSRIARFISEVAPPQYISVIRQRASKMLDTINEEERDACANTSRAASPTCYSSSSTVGVAATDCKPFLIGVQRSFSLFEH
ncbi:hypothetical protein I3843_09G116000 [Carya illinoinensis]|uniref:Uncharacterized protein n=1 Tax=Carya illinoinensis TaxID=32201 RepID=A0A8T1PGN6_CARIL|nr:hypothetical protein I3760_09G116500 [Carya illinoinensis]KAG6642115.1 hypothetical protein CIPAW_09G120800 [Carya illinoinensis]KAG6695863.1 hypothetical protein I3842_09G118300 [Carya illinoinensis]KAG7963409.1 hypothetical protein I3843_09G116000 [Carya illinoinensis]